MSPHQERALLLLEQRRPELAEQELRRALADDPHDAFAHAVLGLCLAEQKRGNDAVAEADTAIALAPEQPFPHYARARILLDAEKLDAAETSIREAIGLDPYDPDAFGVLAAILLGRRRWTDALEAAERGLEIDSEHVGCANLRAMALVQLGRREEAGIALGGALARDPENTHTHANQGWALLHRGEPKPAMEHFREALRLDPENDWAREGLVEALKARNPVYGMMLRYFLWMSRLQPRTQWLVILGGLFLYNFARRIARTNPDLALLAYPVMGAYLLFVLLSWTADHLFNLLLYLNPLGRHALSSDQRRAARWVGFALGTVLIAGTTALAAPGEATRNAALLAGFLLIPTSATFRLPPGRSRSWMGGATLAMYAIAATAIVLFASAGPEADLALPNLLFFAALIGAVASSWIVNVIATRALRR